MGVMVRQKQPGKGNPWWVFIHHQGKRKSKPVGDKKTAEAVAAAIRKRLTLKEFTIQTDQKSPLFEEYASKWLVNHAKIYCKPSTAEDYRKHIAKHLNPFFGSRPLNEITRVDIKDFICAKLASGLAPKTVSNLKGCISSILTSAVEDDLIVANPALNLRRQITKLKQLTMGKGSGSTIDFFTRLEVKHFLTVAKQYSPRYYPLFFTALRAGLRQGELIGLEPGDLDFYNQAIRVERALVRGKLTTPKNGKVRFVDMSKQLQEVLKAWLTQRKEEKLTKGWKELPSWLFYNEQGRALDPSNLRERHFYRCLEKAGLRRIRFHDLRHSYASLLLAQGESLPYVRDQLGHSSIQLTVDTYGHLIPGANRSAVDKLDDGAEIGAPIRTLYAPSGDFGGKKRTEPDG